MNPRDDETYLRIGCAMLLAIFVLGVAVGRMFPLLR